MLWMLNSVYRVLISEGGAPEQARLVLPMATVLNGYGPDH